VLSPAVRFLPRLRYGSLGALIVLAPALLAAESQVRRYLYLSTPDGAQTEGRSGRGILIFDIDDGHKLVRRIELRLFEEGVRGFTGSEKTRRLYYSTTNRRLGCFDIEKDEVVWESVFDAGCDRSSITLDGKRIYVPTGWWYAGEDGGFLVVDAETGVISERIRVGPQAHNSLVSLDGKHVFLGTRTTLSMFEAATGKPVKRIEDVGESGVFPFTVDSAVRHAYVCLGKHVGFDVVDLEAGKRIHRVLAGKEPIAHRTHGAGLTPDETELWISDQDGRKLFIFDATKMPPEPKGHVDLSQGGHGWVTFSLDGAFAWCHTPDVFDARTKKKVATLKDEGGKPVSSSKFIEVHIRDGKVVRIGSEFGLGRKNPQGTASSSAAVQ
jgi:outer membrane protein assembly factor BamB